MATAEISQPITVLPPGPERHDLHFDLHVGIRPKYPVSAEFKAGGEIVSSGLSFDDYTRMATQERKLAPGRRLETPAYTINEQLMAKVVTRYLEMRAGIRKPQRLPLLARIHKAEELLCEQRPALEERLKRMCRKYVMAKKENAPDARLKALAIQIKNLDTILLSTQSGFAEKVVGIIFYYFRCGCDSVETAQRLSLTPPAVRQTIWRLNRTWERMAKEDQTSELPKLVVDVAVARAEGAKFHEIGTRFGISTTVAFRYATKARQAGIRIDDYASYVHFAAHVEVKPMPYEQWRMLEPQCRPKGLRKHQAAVAR